MLYYILPFNTVASIKKFLLKVQFLNIKLLQYHTGYRQQVEKWPKNPLDILIDELKKTKYADKDIGDFGCGEGRLQIDLEKNGHRGKIFSFDVGKAAEHVIQTDIANVKNHYQ